MNSCGTLIVLFKVRQLGQNTTSIRLLAILFYVHAYYIMTRVFSLTPCRRLFDLFGVGRSLCPERHIFLDVSWENTNAWFFKGLRDSLFNHLRMF